MIYVYFMSFHSSLLQGGDAAPWLLNILSAGILLPQSWPPFSGRKITRGNYNCWGLTLSRPMLKWALCQKDLPIGRSSAHQTCLEKDDVLCNFPEIMSLRSGRANPFFATSWRQGTLEIFVCDNCKIFSHCQERQNAHSVDSTSLGILHTGIR